ncbi:MAG: TolC family protein [Thermoanaerobaculia bacterium]|nr:TolC family protein [Thermoanaerobaculia bacterium]
MPAVNKWLLFFGWWMMVFCAPAATPADEPRLDPVGIALVGDGSAAETDLLVDLIEREIQILLEGELDPEFHRRVGEWTLESVRAEIAAVEADPNVHVIVAAGVLASHLFCCEPVLPKPVVAALVVDAEVQGLPRLGEASGRHNLNYLAIPDNIRRDLERLHEIVPFERAVFVSNRWLQEAIPDLFSQFQDEEWGFELDVLPVGDSVDEALASLEGVQAAYVAPLLHLSLEDRQRLIEGLTELRIPSFASLGAIEVERGVLATQRSDEFIERLARRVALNVQRILLGEDAGSLPIDFVDRPRLRINMKTARAIGVDPAWQMRTEAELLFESEREVPVVTLEDALNDAVFRNLGLAAQRKAVEAGEQDVVSARSGLRPNLDATVTGVQIDDDRASPLAGQVERSVRAGVELTQVIWSDAARGNVTIQSSLQEGRRQRLQAVELDALRDAAVAYYNVLRSQTLETIRREDLSLTRSHLDFARIRSELGQAGPAEIYRLESRLADARRALVDASAQVRKARYALNRVRHRPLSDDLRTESDGLTLEYLLMRRGRLLAFTGSPRDFELTSDFMIQEALIVVPELKEIDASIAAQQRGVKSARRAYYSPDIVAALSWDRRLAESGVGSEGDGGSPFSMDIPDETNWSAAVSISLPLFAGGARRADLVGAELALEQLRLQRQELAERLEQAIRSNLQDSQAAFSGIVLTRDSAAAARRGLELVSDAYRQGAADLLELLDAQSSALQAELAAADAQFTFFSELTETERSAGYYYDFLPPEEQEAWFERLGEHFRNQGVEPRPDRKIHLGGDRWFRPGDVP